MRSILALVLALAMAAHVSTDRVESIRVTTQHPNPFSHFIIPAFAPAVSEQRRHRSKPCTESVSVATLDPRTLQSWSSICTPPPLEIPKRSLSVPAENN